MRHVGSSGTRTCRHPRAGASAATPPPPRHHRAALSAAAREEDTCPGQEPQLCAAGTPRALAAGTVAGREGRFSQLYVWRVNAVTVLPLRGQRTRLLTTKGLGHTSTQVPRASAAEAVHGSRPAGYRSPARPEPLAFPERSGI